MTDGPRLYHAFVTRFAVRLHESAALPSQAWLERRFDLFERYCLPSLRSQSVQGFEWLLFYDGRLAEEAVRRLRGYADSWPTIVPLPLQSFWGGRVVNQAVEARLPPDCEAVITSRLDNDDAVARDYVARLRQAALSLEREAVIFDWGFNLAGGRLYIQPLLRGPFASVVCRLEEGGPLITVADADHERLEELVSAVHLGLPGAWIQSVHADNLANRQRGVRVPLRLALRRFPLPALDGIPPEQPLALTADVVASGWRFSRGLLADRDRGRRLLRFLQRRARDVGAGSPLGRCDLVGLVRHRSSSRSRP